MCSVCGVVTVVVPLYFVLEIIWENTNLDVETFNFWIGFVFALLELFVVFGCIYFGVLLVISLLHR